LFRTADDIRNNLIEVGIAEFEAELLSRQARAAVWLETHAVDDESEIAIGATKFGGSPDLPADAKWPIRPAYPDAEKRTQFFRQSLADSDKSAWPWAKPEDRERLREAFRQDTLNRIRMIESEQPLSFVAQINLKEMWAEGPLDPDMPREGVLSIFYDLMERPWGYDPATSIGFSILFHEIDGEPWTRRDAAPSLPTAQVQTLMARLNGKEPPEPDDRLFPLACIAHACMTPLPARSAQIDQLGLSDTLMDQLWQDWHFSDDGPTAARNGEHWECHHVSGWPTPIQGDMQTKCALVHAGHYCGDGDAYNDPALAAIRATATDWLLLAQIGTDAKGNMMWGDSGQLYVWIRRDDLKARRFENALLLLQCY